MSGLRLFLLGPPRVELDNAFIDIQRRKALALLIFLAVTGQPHSRDALATLFFPEQDQRRARSYLRRDLAALNTSLPGDWLAADREAIGLKQEADIWLDVDHFRSRLTACQDHDHPPEVICPDCLPLLTEAAALYADDFLAGFTLRDSPEFDEWQFFQAETLRRELASVLERLAYGLSEQEEYEAAIPYARRWMALDPLHEPAQRQLMQLYSQLGEVTAALRQYEEYLQLLDKEFGIPPGEETTTLYEAIKANRIFKPFLRTQLQIIEKEEASTPPGGSLPSTVGASRPLHNLPPQPTPFVGREQELLEIKQLLLNESDCRLLSLVGPGGIGKTRLVLETATEALDSFPHGVFFVSLVPVIEARYIISAIAEALNITFQGETEPKAQLLKYLRQRSLLLVVDNFEHLMDGVQLISEILSTTHQVTLLVTSRERLNLQEEWVYEVQGMPYPQMSADVRDVDPQTLEIYGAIRLFIQRARQAEAHFALLKEDVPHVIRLCQLVDGMPLGLELAAPWVRSMTCQEIADEVRRNLDFLTTSLSNLPERHRSLRAVFEQSWQRLSVSEQYVTSKFSVFRGGCLREAAEAVTGASLADLSSLVDKALLRRTRSGRYEMHELIRQFAAEQLQTDSAHEQQAQDRHYAYYTSFLKQYTQDLKGGRQKEALAEIAADIDNVRAAWQRAIICRDIRAIGQAAECFCLYSEMRGALNEGEIAFQQGADAFIAPSQDKDVIVDEAALRGFFLAGQGMLRAHRGRLKEGQALMEQGLSLLRQIKHHEPYLREEAFVLLWLGWVLFLQGEVSESEHIVQESQALYSKIGDRWGVAKSLFVLGNSLTAKGHLEEAEPPLRKSLEICIDIEDRRSHLLVNRNLAILTFWFGDYVQTRQLLEEAAMLSQEFDDRIGLAYTLRELGKLEVAQGEYTQAIETLQESVAITDEIGSDWESAATLDDLGIAFHVKGDYGAAERYLSQCLEAARSINNQYYTARSLSDLGSLALDKGEYHQAEQYQQQALAHWAEFAENGHEPYSAWVLCQLGHVMSAMGEKRYVEAKQYYQKALFLSTKHKLAPFAMDIFVGVAVLLVHTGQMQNTAELLSLPLHHPASTYQTREKARRLLGELAMDLPNKDLPSAQASDQILDWQLLAERTIKMLSTPNE